MKKIAGVFIIIALVAGGVAGCKKLIQSVFPGFDMDIPAITVTIPAIPLTTPNEVQIGTWNQYFNLDSTIRASTNGAFSAKDVTSVKISRLKFTVSNADQQNNLSNFERLRFTFNSNTNTQVAEIAAITFPETYTDNYTYTPETPPELRGYLNGNQLSYNLYGKIRRITAKALTITMVITMKVK